MTRSSSRVRAALLEETSHLGIALTESQIDRLARYLDLIARWRRRAGLTAIDDPIAAARLHIADSLLCLRAEVGATASLIDVGSGAGLPGIPLKVARPDLQVFLLESAAGKAAFLEIAVRELALDVRVIQSRAEDVARDPDLREQFDVATARAVAPLAALCELTLPFVRTGGTAVLLKGPNVGRELKDGREAAEALGGEEPVLLEARLRGGERRVVVVIRKAESSPAAFPRRAVRVGGRRRRTILESNE